MKITSATFLTSATEVAACPDSPLPEIAFIGRSNVGKSSLLNMLSGEAKLAKISSTPGHTKLINFFVMNDTWCMVDLPGYGFTKAKPSERADFERMIADYLTRRENLLCVLVLIDSRHEPQVIDLEFVEWLVEHRVRMALVFTKSDKLKLAAVARNMAAFQKIIAPLFPEPPPSFACSVITKDGRRELMGFLGKVLTGG